MNKQNRVIDGEEARLFFALWPPVEVSERLHAEALACSKKQGGRAMQQATLHMTLLFLGEVAHRSIPSLVEEVEGMQWKPFVLRLNALHCWRHNRIAYAASDKIPELHTLAEQLRLGAAKAGLSFDARTYTPHVTLIRKLEKPFEPQPLALPEWKVTQFALVESRLQAAGPLYRNLQSWSCC